MNREPSAGGGEPPRAEPAPHEADTGREKFPAGEVRFRAFVDAHLDFTWRSLRRLGLPAHVVDDATQRVFLVASQKLASIAPGSERAFLFNAAIRVASSERRSFARRREVLSADETAHDVPDPAAGADELIDHSRARALLDDLVQELSMDLRTVFVLFELEGMTTVEIASTLGIPRGTVASRLRRARDEFRAELKRRHARTAPVARRT